MATVFGAVLVAGVREGILEDQENRARAGGHAVHVLNFEMKTNTGALRAHEAKLPDETPVIGIVAGEHSRAYEVAAFARDEDHVLNDLLGGVPITVAYCPVTECARVYVGTPGSGPIPMAVGGWFGPPGRAPGDDSVMLVRVGSTLYLQDTGEAVDGSGRLPYSECEFDLTSWGEWKREYPNTDVVTRKGPQKPREQSGLEQDRSLAQP